MTMTPARLFTTGNSMSARAAVDAGCRFFAGYPITPASEIFAEMTRALPALGGVGMSAPDEISAIAYCIGASIAGARAMTATSGPGWCLMIESVGYAVMTETPLVVAVVQRLGPCTGAATLGAQGDIGLVSMATSGGYTFPIFAPSSAQECYEDTLRAFEWSERLRTPVVVLSDKEVSSTQEVVDVAGLPSVPDFDRPRWSGDGPFDTYAFLREEDVPAFVPVGSSPAVTVTGSAHDKAGRLRKDDPETLSVLRHLQRKIDAAEPELATVDWDPDPGARTLLISYGVSARACRDALAIARSRGVAVSMVNARTLFPLPRTALARALEGIERVVVVEENLGGQYRMALGNVLRGKTVVGVNRMGAMIRPQEVVDAL